MNSIQVFNTPKFINNLPNLLTEIGTSLNNSSVKKGLLLLSIPEVFVKTLKKFLYDRDPDPKYVKTDEDIHSAVQLWCSNRDKALTLYGHISYWNTSLVTNMNWLFGQCVKFNDNISEWDVSKVKTMKNMFYYAKTFNQPIGDWDVSKVSDMQDMFWKATSFNKPIGKWDISNVTYMGSMFYDAAAFNQPINTKIVERPDGTTYTAWNVSKVKNMEYMFCRARSFNQPIGGWNVSKVENMKEMFSGAINNEDCGHFQISDQLNRQQSSTEDDAEEEDVDMTNVDAKHVELVVEHARCSKAEAVKALKNNENDIVNAIIDLTM